MKNVEFIHVKSDVPPDKIANQDVCIKQSLSLIHI